MFVNNHFLRVERQYVQNIQLVTVDTSIYKNIQFLPKNIFVDMSKWMF
jgi:hypothetical protein